MRTKKTQSPESQALAPASEDREIAGDDNAPRLLAANPTAAPVAASCRGWAKGNVQVYPEQNERLQVKCLINLIEREKATESRRGEESVQWAPQLTEGCSHV